MQKFLKAIHLPGWLVGVLALAFVLRIPSFFEPYYYGDEMIYLTLGQGIRQGLTLYSQIFDNKPPLLYLIAAVAGNLFWFKAILAFWNMATIIVFAKLAGKLLKNGDKIATLIFALLTTLPLFEGNIANAELFMLLPSLSALYILFSYILNPKSLILAGSLFGLAALFKIPAAFDLPVIIFYWLIVKQRSWFKSIFYLALGFTLPILVTFIWSFSAGILPEYFRAAFLQNIGYLGSLKPPVDVPIFIRAGVILVGLVVVFLVRKRLSKNFILFSIWTLFSLFAASLSQRPYPHYLIQTTPAIAFLLAMFFAAKTKEQVFTVLPLTLITFVPFFYKYYHYETLAYYQRFINFAIGKTNKDLYFFSFSPKIKRNYEVASFIALSSQGKDRVFIWDPDAPVIHALSRHLPPVKFTVPYHVYDYSSRGVIANQLTQSEPRFIILTSGYQFPEITDFLHQNYILVAQFEDANIYSKIPNISI